MLRIAADVAALGSTKCRAKGETTTEKEADEIKHHFCAECVDFYLCFEFKKGDWRGWSSRMEF
jgi:hypothetical protein